MVLATTSRVPNRWFQADRYYRKGDTAWLTYLKDYDLGVISRAPLTKPSDALEIFGMATLLGGWMFVVVTVSSNLFLMGVLVWEHLRLARWKSAAHDPLHTKIPTLGRALAEATSVSLLMFLIVALFAGAARVSVAMPTEGYLKVGAYYCMLAVVLCCHLVPLLTHFVLSCFRSRVGSSIKEILALVVLAPAIFTLLKKVVVFSLSDEVLRFESWLDVAKAFGETLLS